VVADELVQSLVQLAALTVSGSCYATDTSPGPPAGTSLKASVAGFAIGRQTETVFLISLVLRHPAGHQPAPDDGHAPGKQLAIGRGPT